MHMPNSQMYPGLCWQQGRESSMCAGASRQLAAAPGAARDYSAARLATGDALVAVAEDMLGGLAHQENVCT